MKVIITLDDKNGMMFNNRRQSRDRAVTEHILALAEGKTLWVSPYTQKLIENTPGPKEKKPFDGRRPEDGESSPGRRLTDQIGNGNFSSARRTAEQPENGNSSLCAPSRRPALVKADEAFLEKAAEGDFCWAEDRHLAPWEGRIEELYLFRWNRRYPGDFFFDLDLADGSWILAGTEEFAGHSHEKITLEAYRHAAKS